MGFPSSNNLQWLRIALASQVLVEHSAAHIGHWAPDWLSNMPGVPAFFFVSGFLIYSSYRTTGGKDYFRNRFLRLFPALLVVTLGGMLVVLFAHGLRDFTQNPLGMTVWFLSQVTIGQAYNPPMFRDIGVGGLNGSLWTITTEILFYLTVPLIVWGERRFSALVPALTAVSFVVYANGTSWWPSPVYRDKTVFDILALTPLVWGWMFGTGMLVARYYDALSPYWRYLPVVALSGIPMILANQNDIWLAAHGNRLGILYFVAYVAFLIWFAFSTPFVPIKADLSYGTYIWHMPVINLVLVSTLPRSFPMVVLLTFGLALLSWILVESPALRLKRSSIQRP